MTFFTIGQVREANRVAGWHFFDRSTLRFFDSRIDKTVYGGRYFVTSEQFHGSNGVTGRRLYTIREALDSGDVRTVGAFQAYYSMQEAKAAIRRMLAEEREGVAS